jgi:protein subunit release factor B
VSEVLPERQRITILSKKDLSFSTFCGSGAGGQARNKVHSGCQIRHEESGATGRASDSRSLEQNKQSAFKRLLEDPRMKFWLAKKVYEVKAHETVEQTLEKETQPDNLKFEVKNALGRWEEVPNAYFETEAAKEVSD